MGSGLSLTDKQVTYIMKRDLLIDYNILIKNRHPCAHDWTLYRNQLDNDTYVNKVKKIEQIYNDRNKTEK